MKKIYFYLSIISLMFTANLGFASTYVLNSTNGYIENRTSLDTKLLKLRLVVYDTGDLCDGCHNWGRELVILDFSPDSSGRFTTPDITLKNTMGEISIAIDLIFPNKNNDSAGIVVGGPNKNQVDFLAHHLNHLIFDQLPGINEQSVTISTPGNLTFEQYVTKALAGTKYLDKKKYQWEIQVGFSFLGEYGRFVSRYKSVPCFNPVSYAVCAASLTDSSGAKFASLYSGVNDDGSTRYTFFHARDLPKDDSSILDITMELNVWDRKKQSRIFFKSISPFGDRLDPRSRLAVNPMRQHFKFELIKP